MPPDRAATSAGGPSGATIMKRHSFVACYSIRMKPGDLSEKVKNLCIKVSRAVAKPCHSWCSFWRAWSSPRSVRRLAGHAAATIFR